MLGLDLEPDHDAAAAALERGLEQPHQIFGLFLDFHSESRMTRNRP
jgi:hypothetical protein